MVSDGIGHLLGTLLVSHFEISEAGIQAGQPERRGTVSQRNETKKPFPSQIICGLAPTCERLRNQKCTDESLCQVSVSNRSVAL